VIVAAATAGSYEERTCMRCFKGRVYDIERGDVSDRPPCDKSAPV
jgi:hypothetical protein